MSDALSTELPWRLSLFHFVRYICAFIHGRVSQRCLLPLWWVWDTFFCLLAITLRLQLRYDYFQYPYTSLAALCICQFSENLLVTGGGNGSPSHLNACTWTHAQLIKKKTSHTPLRLLRFTVSDSWVKERTINLRVCCLCWTHYNEN